jgi:hypothetical protein
MKSADHIFGGPGKRLNKLPVAAKVFALSKLMIVPVFTNLLSGNFGRNQDLIVVHLMFSFSSKK